eukprot:1843895-Rhodomonas_salina.1
MRRKGRGEGAPLILSWVAEALEILALHRARVRGEQHPVRPQCGGQLPAIADGQKSTRLRRRLCRPEAFLWTRMIGA